MKHKTELQARYNQKYKYYLQTAIISRLAGQFDI